MAIKKKSGGGGGGANWMDTYGDMVTLLLCFFVLLYSMSTISEEKWKAVVQSFNPSALETTTETSGDLGPLADPVDGFGMETTTDPDITQEEINDAIEALYQTLKNYAESQNLEPNVEVTKGDGYVFISFNDAVFFDGDSPVIRPDGQEILDVVCGALDTAAPYIDELRIMGHTAQARPDEPNEISGDRRLASNRATNVTIYIQERVTLDPARIVTVAYGQHRPVDSNDTEETRRHNRRCELLITGRDLLNKLGDSIEQYTSLRTGEASLLTESAN